MSHLPGEGSVELGTERDQNPRVVDVQFRLPTFVNGDAVTSS